MFFHSMVASLTPDHPATPHVAEFLGWMDANPPQTLDECLAAYDGFVEEARTKGNKEAVAQFRSGNLDAFQRDFAAHRGFDSFRSFLIGEWKLMFGEEGHFVMAPHIHGG